VISTAAPTDDLGLTISETVCPKCGSAMFVKRCPCPFKRKGWATCAKCAGCGHTVGLVMRARSARVGGAPHRRGGSPFRHI